MVTSGGGVFALLWEGWDGTSSKYRAAWSARAIVPGIMRWEWRRQPIIACYAIAGQGPSWTGGLEEGSALDLGSALSGGTAMPLMWKRTFVVLLPRVGVFHRRSVCHDLSQTCGKW